ncbi:MAG: phosphoribosylformylglycinamidine synthase subunit PurQ, partial [Thermoplasmata archaeon]|nr:phosphoribosylformylglycinamidine synthase subunit PurQ [Thermoplasmata archaeon]
MDLKDIRVAVLRIEGTNCEEESFLAFKRLGADPEMVHLKQLTGDSSHPRKLKDYHALMFPGGFSAGDYVRAGAIFSARIKSSLGRDLVRFVEDGYPVLGICNGFQILV